MADFDRVVTPKLGLIGLDVADAFGYEEKIEFTEVMRQNFMKIDALGASGSVGNAVTTADLTFHISTASGSDTNDGLTAGTAFKTIQKAIDSVPTNVRHIVTLRVYRGTYAETIRDGHFYGDNGLFTGKIILEGQDYDVFTPATGPSSGTLVTAPASGSTWAVVGTPGWTSNNLKGKFIRLTSGAQSGNWYPIAGNAAGTIDIPNTSTQLNNATFEIIQHAVEVTRTPGLFGSFIVSNAGAALSNNGLQPKRLKINPGSTYGVYVAGASVNPFECHISGFNFAGVFAANIASQIGVSRCFIAPPAGQIGIGTNEHSSCYAGGTVIDGGAICIDMRAAQMRAGANASGHVICQNATVAGMRSRGGPMMGDSFSSQKFILRNNACGLLIESGFHWLMQFWEITDNTGPGIRIQTDGQVTGHNSLHMFTCRIRNNTGDGIRVETFHNNIHFGFSGDISGNGGAGIKFGGGPSNYSPACFNNAFLDSGITMSNNAAGDLIHDGTTVTSLAALRALGNKTIVDNTIFFNRMAGN